MEARAADLMEFHLHMSFISVLYCSISCSADKTLISKSNRLHVSRQTRHMTAACAALKKKKRVMRSKHELTKEKVTSPCLLLVSPSPAIVPAALISPPQRRSEFRRRVGSKHGNACEYCVRCIYLNNSLHGIHFLCPGVEKHELMASER